MGGAFVGMVKINLLFPKQGGLLPSSCPANIRPDDNSLCEEEINGDEPCSCKRGTAFQ
jgi:hypothetical protein